LHLDERSAELGLFLFPELIIGFGLTGVATDQTSIEENTLLSFNIVLNKQKIILLILIGAAVV